MQIKAWVDIGKQSPAMLSYDGKPVVFPYAVGFPDGRYKEKNNELVSVGEKRDLVDWFAAQGDPIAYAAVDRRGLAHSERSLAKDPAAGFQKYAFGVGSFTPQAPLLDFQKALDYWPPSLLQMGENSFIYYNGGWSYNTGKMDLSGSYRRMWDWNVAHRDRYRWLMLVTWNDWGETAIAPSVNHFMAWQPVTRYYADWFKTGKQPEIKREWIEVFHRPHPFAAKPSLAPFRVQDRPGFSLTPPNDVVEALAFLKAAGDAGDSHRRQGLPQGCPRRRLIVCRSLRAGRSVGERRLRRRRGRRRRLAGSDYRSSCASESVVHRRRLAASAAPGESQ